MLARAHVELEATFQTSRRGDAFLQHLHATRRLVTGSNAASLPPKLAYLSLCTPVIPHRPLGAHRALGKRVEASSTAMTARIRVGSILVRAHFS